jgi:DNA-binding NtrC family response regulator
MRGVIVIENNSIPGARILILGVEESIGADLHRVLGSQGHTVFSEPFRSADGSLEAIDRLAADLVFCASETPRFEALLACLRAQARSVPVVVASPIPELDIWLDALDAGAHDYCAAPFEPRLVGQIVNNALSSRCRLPVARATPSLTRPAEARRTARP